jgi:proprotein convertase subtilisin/kexin type 5
LYDASCESTCPEKYWANNETNTCDHCDSTCATCLGADYNNCWTCPEGTYFHEYECKVPCPGGTFEEEEPI